LQTVSTAWSCVRGILKALSGSEELVAIDSVPSGMEEIITWFKIIMVSTW